MMKLIYYGIFHTILLASLVYREYKKNPWLFPLCISISQNNGLHLVHTIFVMLLIYAAAKLLITYFLGQIRSDEVTIVNDSCFMFLTDILLVVTIFSEDLTIKNLIVFSILLALKCINWVIIERIKSQQNTRIIALVIIEFIMTTFFCFASLSYALKKPSLFILFAYEFGILSLFCLRNCAYIFIQKNEDTETPEGEEKKTIQLFINDITFLGMRLICVVSFFAFTTLNFRLPFNLLREAISTIRQFYKKVNGLARYIGISKQLDKLDDYIPNSDNNLCPICFSEMETGKKIDCGHVFHKSCLKKCVETSEVCPICRRDLFKKDQTVSFISGNEVITGVPVSYAE